MMMRHLPSGTDPPFTSNKEYVDPYDMPKVDPVNSPQHYNYGNIQYIDYLQDNLKEGFEFYCDGNVKKYRIDGVTRAKS